jgi:hypothetical protein
MRVYIYTDICLFNVCIQSFQILTLKKRAERQSEDDDDDDHDDDDPMMPFQV